jgi:hypothetical protein
MKLHFDPKGQYWMKLADDRFIGLGKDDVKLHVMRAGASSQRKDADDEPGLTTTESILWRAQTHGLVAYAGPLAGHRAGPLCRPSGERILVTNQCAAFNRKPARGKPFRFIEAYLEAIFEDGHEHVIAWLSRSLKTLLKGDFAPGQMLALAGPPGCGKSFFHWLVTELLGGRMGKPYLFLTGKTPFNGDLARAEHLVVEDEATSTDMRTRLRYGAAIKQFTVNEEMHVHDKGKIAFTAPTMRRITTSMNSEPEELMQVPPLVEGIKDKLMLLKCRDARNVLHEERELNKSAVRKELPAFHAYLTSYRIPSRISEHRFGVTTFHNESLLEALGETTPEARLVNLIDEVLFGQGNREVKEWRGTATELEMQLRNSSFGPVAANLFYYSTACGVFLARLAGKHPERFHCVKSKGRTSWEVNRES